MSSRPHARAEARPFGQRLDRASAGAVQDRAFGFLSLFASFGTLVCCALPSLLVLLGLGATVASLLSAAPWLVTVSRHKDWVFAGSGALIAVNIAYIHAVAPRLRTDRTCPGDPTACGTADRVSRVVLWVSAAIYVVGFTTAYLLEPILAGGHSAIITLSFGTRVPRAWRQRPRSRVDVST